MAASSVSPKLEQALLRLRSNDPTLTSLDLSSNLIGGPSGTSALATALHHNSLFHQCLLECPQWLLHLLCLVYRRRSNLTDVLLCFFEHSSDRCPTVCVPNVSHRLAPIQVLSGAGSPSDPIDFNCAEERSLFLLFWSFCGCCSAVDEFLQQQRGDEDPALISKMRSTLCVAGWLM